MTARIGRCSLVLALTLAAGCSYPEFQFGGTDRDGAAALDSGPDAANDVGVVVVDALDDTMREETAVPDATTDPLDAFVDVRDETVGEDVAPDTRDAATDTRDAATDARDAADAFDAKPLRFCDQAAHFFCNDFDASDIVEYGWSGFAEFSGGAYSLQSTSTSSPRALRVVATPVSGAADLGALVTRILTAPSIEAVVRMEADLQVDAATYGGGTMVLLKIQRGGGRGIVLGIGSNGLRLEMIGAGTAYKMVPLAKVVTAGTWIHVRIDTTLRVAGGTAKVWLDGMPYADETNVSTATADDTYREVVVGLYAQPPLLPFAARMDSVTVDFSP